MNEYVKASAAAKIIGQQLGISLADMCDIMQNVPAADVKPVVHGRWGFVDGDTAEYESGHCGWAEYSCSVCGNEVAFEEGEYGFGSKEDENGVKIPFNYCPFCGAEMDWHVERTDPKTQMHQYASDIRRCAAKDTLTTVDRDMLMDIADRLEGCGHG